MSKERVLAAIESGARSADRISTVTGMPVHAVRTYLSRLRCAGTIKTEWRYCDACGKRHKAYVILGTELTRVWGAKAA